MDKRYREKNKEILKKKERERKKQNLGHMKVKKNSNVYNIIA